MLFNFNGVNLINCGKGVYKFDTAYGSLLEIMAIMNDVGIDIDEINYALDVMCSKGDQVAHFGMGGSFIFTREIRETDLGDGVVGI